MSEDLELRRLRDRVRSWVNDQRERLGPFRVREYRSVEDESAHECQLQALLHETGIAQIGWPQEVGGHGGGAVHRGIVYDELAAAGIIYPHHLEAMEVVGPALIRYTPELASRHFPAILRGESIWCQGFSEPNAGSDLASLTTRATRHGDGFRLNGQKVWQTLGHVSQWCALLARTGATDSRHRGLTMFWLDLNTPGVTVRPIHAANGRRELAEIFLDDAFVPADHSIGSVDAGWSVAMYMLQFERGLYAWQRQARLGARLREALVRSESVTSYDADQTVGAALIALAALRCRAQETVARLAGGAELGPETSVDKILLSTAEQTVDEACRALTYPAFEVGDDDWSRRLRSDWFYGRATTVFGGAVEVQRDIVAERLLALPRSR